MSDPLLKAGLSLLGALDKKFDPNQRRDDHGRWSETGGGRTGGGGRSLNGAKVPAEISADTQYPSMMSKEERVKTFGFDISTGGDAVPGGYNGYIKALDPENGKPMGMIEYNSAGRPYYEATVAMVQTEPDYAKRGVATNLLQCVRAELPEYEFSLGGLTDEGSAWRSGLPAHLQEDVIPALKFEGKGLRR